MRLAYQPNFNRNLNDVDTREITISPDEEYVAGLYLMAANLFGEYYYQRILISNLTPGDFASHLCGYSPDRFKDMTCLYNSKYRYMCRFVNPLRGWQFAYLYNTIEFIEGARKCCDLFNLRSEVFLIIN